jgi:DNA repair protein RadC
MASIRELPPHERPRRRLEQAGPHALTDAELLAIILRDSGSGQSVLDVAQALLVDYRTLAGIRRAHFAELAARRGMGPANAAQLLAAIEVARRLLLGAADERPQIRSPQDAAQLMLAEMGHLDQEQLRTICLDTRNRVQKVHTVYVGSLNSSMVRVGEVFKEALRLNSAAIIVVHNHPSADPTPSPEDVLVTRQIVEAGKLLDVEVLDHLVIGLSRFVSMRERGLAFGS